MSPINRPTLAELRAFMAVAEYKSFRRAADMLGVTRSSLSHVMKTLEDTLGTRLLHRTTRSVSLTEAGERLMNNLEPLLNGLNVALENVSGDHNHLIGRLRINGNEGGIRILLASIVPTFMQRYPHVELDLVAEGSLVDIVEAGFDAGIRLAEAVPKDMVAVRLGPEVRFLAVASPDYFARCGTPNVPDDLLQHQCLRQRLPSGKRYRWEFLKHGQETALDVPGMLTLDNLQLTREAAIDGLGIAYLPDSYANESLSNGELVAVLQDWSPTIAGLCLYFPQNRHMPANLRALIDIIREIDAATR
ncbi:LysR family transcriptional regulator [Rouxiella silvae]|uniref:LysR family transcriptional regulator n=1 Tax=Rouxiella silvae TaxID=1646373 RepID=A0AA41BXA4_9GAMM|nr:LysR family transcriptional regulator [Rouxiella silvae]KQN46593.1 LysR family transcriptional regulator [Serratia sp. Leaf50]MBF6637981.1 LysR family transcriptional regulator [Rouxiella silvae]ORJ20808.1 LysR family transcriptional regulator [Rouxiella silvae]